jgi:predicted transcriptional regulator
MTNRSRTDIVSKILQAANGNGSGTTKTKMMYQAFLSYGQLKDYLVVLMDNDLLSYDSATCKFKTTKKGLSFIEVYNQMDDMIKAV